jgi:hypothetical protein
MTNPFIPSGKEISCFEGNVFSNEILAIGNKIWIMLKIKSIISSLEHRRQLNRWEKMKFEILHS